MTENIGQYGHDDQPDEQIHDDHLDADAERHREIEEWIDAVTRRPWFVALNSLPGDRGLWVGTEDELMEELKERVGPDATLSKDFPSNVDEIIEPPRDVEFAMRQERLDIMDYRKMTKKIRENFDGPGWGHSARIMIERGLAGHKPYHEAAAYLMTTKYRNPLAALVVEFTYHNPKFTRNNREWRGRTRELAEQLSIRYMDEVAFVESRRNKELEEVLNIEGSSDLRRFCERMRTCAYILRDVGVKVKWQRVTDRKATTDEKYTYTRWMIEAPRWRRSEPHF
jgi:hypothetical protein